MLILGLLGKYVLALKNCSNEIRIRRELPVPLLKISYLCKTLLSNLYTVFKGFEQGLASKKWTNCTGIFFYFTHLFDIIWHWILFFYPCPKRSISKLLYFLNFRWSNYCLGNPDGILKPFWATLMSQFWIQKVEGSIEKFWG